MKKCTKCKQEKPLDEFHKKSTVKSGKQSICKNCINKDLRERRKNNNNFVTRKYEKTVNGFLMRLYRNMQSRIEGIQKEKKHLYKNKELLNRICFYNWAKEHPVFKTLFIDWKKSNYNRKLTPSVDRINPSKGYNLDNMEWVTHSENSRRGTISKIKKYNLNVKIK